jgi:tRNA threonylcarbamoyl adenosine modification protein YeaZ
MRILALEFSSLTRSVAVVAGNPGGGGPAILAEVADDAAGRMDPLGLVQEAMRRAQLQARDLDALAVGLGPGSQAGIRNAIALAQGWQLALPVPVMGVGSHEVLACQAIQAGLRGKAGLVFDAQRGEFYLFHGEIHGASEAVWESLRIVPAETIQTLSASGVVILGPGCPKWFSGSQDLRPAATVLGRLALDRPGTASASGLEPIHLRATQFVKAPPPRQYS